MKVIVLGAGGRLGSRVLAECVRSGHEVTAFVRSAERLRNTVGDELCSRVAVVEGDVLAGAELAAAMAGQEACVQAAGYIGNTPEEGGQLHKLVVAATEAADAGLVGARRLWVLGGAGALDLPGRGCMLLDVPGFPFPKYRIHKTNYAFLSLPKHDSLDWSFACPGVMLDSHSSTPAAAAAAAAGAATAGAAPPPLPARVSVDELPVSLPSWSCLLPTALLLPAVAAIKDQLVGPSYGEVAASMVAHLGGGGTLRHKRVGFAAPARPSQRPQSC